MRERTFYNSELFPNKRRHSRTQRSERSCENNCHCCCCRNLPQKSTDYSVRRNESKYRDSFRRSTEYRRQNRARSDKKPYNGPHPSGLTNRERRRIDRYVKFHSIPNALSSSQTMRDIYDHLASKTKPALKKKPAKKSKTLSAKELAAKTAKSKEKRKRGRERAKAAKAKAQAKEVPPENSGEGPFSTESLPASHSESDMDVTEKVTDSRFVCQDIRKNVPSQTFVASGKSLENRMYSDALKTANEKTLEERDLRIHLQIKRGGLIKHLKNKM